MAPIWDIWIHNGAPTSSTHSPKELEERKSGDKSRISAMYDAGDPFFTKEAIRDLYQQLKTATEYGQKVSVRGLDRAVLEFTVLTGEFHAGSEADSILRKPVIEYRSPQGLLSDFPGVFPELAYCPLSVHHYTDQQKKRTGEIIPIYPTRTLNEVEETFGTNLQIWEESGFCKQVKSILASLKLSSNITKVIGIACGPLSSRRASFQHALLLTIQEVLGRRNSNRMIPACYAQDPMYVDAVKSVLADFGITVLDDPEAFLMVNDSTALVSCSPDIPVKEIIADIARPAIIFWDRVRAREGGFRETDPNSSRVREMIHKFYDIVDFPVDFANFDDLVIYVRRRAGLSG